MTHPGQCHCGTHENLGVYYTDDGVGAETVACAACAAEEGYADWLTDKSVGIRTSELANDAVQCETCRDWVPGEYAQGRASGACEWWVCYECAGWPNGRPAKEAT